MGNCPSFRTVRLPCPSERDSTVKNVKKSIDYFLVTTDVRHVAVYLRVVLETDATTLVYVHNVREM